MASPVRKVVSDLIIRQLASPKYTNAPVAALHGRTDRSPTEKAQDTIRDAKEWIKTSFQIIHL
jgi:hypothetical protein